MQEKSFNMERIIRELGETGILLGQGGMLGEVSRKLGATDQT